MTLPQLAWRLPYAVAGATPALAATDFTRLSASVVEVTAKGHWLLGGDSSSLLDLTEGAALTLNATAPNYSADHIQVANAGYNGLKTPFADSANQTIVGVFQRRVGNADGSTNSMLFSTYNTAGTQGDALFVLTLGSYYRVTGPASSAAFTMPGTDGDWIWLAYTQQSGVGTTLLIGSGGSVTRIFAAGTKTPNASALVSIGNSGSFANTGYQRGPRCAEFMYFDTPQTDVFLTDLYTRTRARKTGRNLSITPL